MINTAFEINASWLLATYVIACFAVVIVPGPSVTVIIANSLRQGPRAGLLNVLGTQLGLLPMVLVVAFGLETITTQLAGVFYWLKLAGGAYLIYLGYRLLRSNGGFVNANIAAVAIGDAALIRQGFIVIWSNPKALLFFGAFIPQFVDPLGNAVMQTTSLGLIFMAVATVFDSIYAIIAGKAGMLLSRGRVRMAEIFSGSILVLGGAWLALSKQT